jgi:hypothetical protein
LLLELLRLLLEQSMIMTMRLLWQRSLLLRLLKESAGIQFTWATLLQSSRLYLCIHQWNCWCWITLLQRYSNCTCGCYYGNCKCTNNCWYYWWSNETFSIASGTASATGTINDNDNAPTVATITPATEGSAVFELHWATLLQLSRLYFYIHQWNCWGADYTTLTLQTVPAGATTGTVRVPTTADTDEVNETFYHCSGTASATGTSMIMTMLQLWQRSSASLLKDPAVVFNFTVSPSALSDYTFTLQWNCKCWLYYYNCYCNRTCATTGTVVGTNNCWYDWWK